MLVFDPKEPYPHRPLDEVPYAEAQAHSDQVDQWLGLQTVEIEKALSKGSLGSVAPEKAHQLWIGLPVKSMLTPYTELRFLLEYLKPEPGQAVVDLGAGYGRMGFVAGSHFQGVRFVGYEFVPERVNEGRRCLGRFSFPGVELLQADLESPEFSPEPAEYYFLYDYGTRRAIEKTLLDLQRIAQSRPITVVGRGRASRDAIERAHPWLSAVVTPEHFAHFSIYRSAV